MVRIKAESLCLDHTFDPWASETPMNIGYFIKMAESPYIDQVLMLLSEENDAFYYDELNHNEKVVVTGWVDASLFTIGNES